MTQMEKGFDFRGWMTRNGLSNRLASLRLGLSRRTVIRYANRQMEVPKTVALACEAVEKGLDNMADVKPINMHKRLAQGEKITGMKKGGAVKGGSKPKPTKGGKSC